LQFIGARKDKDTRDSPYSCLVDFHVLCYVITPALPPAADKTTRMEPVDCCGFAATTFVSFKPVVGAEEEWKVAPIERRALVEAVALAW
jgi:hypothetical protein